MECEEKQRKWVSNKKIYLNKSVKIPYNPPFVHIMGEYAHDTKKDLVKDYSLFVKFK